MVLLGIDDLVFDLLWIGKGLQGRWRSRSLIPPQETPSKHFAIFIPLWRESAVIAPMVEHMMRQWPVGDYDIFLGCYPNDAATLSTAQALSAQHIQVHCIINVRAGPTTKADNLNNLWRAVVSSIEWRDKFDAIVLHDAEDKVHAEELQLYSAYLADHDMIQIPVVPLPDHRSKWVAGHYMDEFAEAHNKEMPLRCALGAPIPSAGVGTALSMDLVRRQTAKFHDPFDADSVTEDYELGWRIGLSGRRTIFVRATGTDGKLIATRAFFPDTLSASIRQKARWVLGIALQGWDRLVEDVAHRRLPGTGFKQTALCSLYAYWMLWRDRRTVLSSIFLLAGYWGACFYGLIVLMKEMAPNLPISAIPFSQAWQFLFTMTAGFIVWRLALRAYFVWREYGLGEALLSIPRVGVSNAVAIVAGHRALFQYLKWICGAPQRWDKTDHRFPDTEQG